MFTNSNLAALLLLLIHVSAGQLIRINEAKENSRPYMVLLEGKTGEEITYCTGILLNRNFVLTTDCCQAKTYVAVLGLHDMDQKKGVQNFSVEQTFISKGFYESRSNHLMLLKLSSKAKFTYQVRPIVLAEQDDGSLPGKCSVAGWGRNYWNNTWFSTKLMEDDVTLFNSNYYIQQHLYRSSGQIGPYEGCGGPLVCEDKKAYGLMYGVSGSTGTDPEYSYIKIPDYMEWIDSTMKKICCLEYF